MTDDRWEEELAKLVHEHVAGIKRSRENVDLTTAPEAVELLDIADLLWEAAHGAPPLEQDPVAAMLGLVPDSAHSLNNTALKQAMQRAGLKTSDLAERLSKRGWDVANRDVFLADPKRRHRAASSHPGDRGSHRNAGRQTHGGPRRIAHSPGVQVSDRIAGLQVVGRTLGATSRHHVEPGSLGAGIPTRNVSLSR